MEAGNQPCHRSAHLHPALRLDEAVEIPARNGGRVRRSRRLRSGVPHWLDEEERGCREHQTKAGGKVATLQGCYGDSGA